MPEKIKVLVTYEGLPERHIQQIRGVSDRIEVVQVTGKERPLEAVRDSEIIFGRFNREMFLASKSLKWIQVASAGVDRHLFPELVESKVILTSSRAYTGYLSPN